jgi:PKD repeat protein
LILDKKQSDTFANNWRESSGTTKLFTKYGRDAYQHHHLKHFQGMLRCYSGGKKRHRSEDSKKGGGKMKPVSRGVVSFIACVVLIVSFSAAVSAGNEVFVVSAGSNGDANYMVSHGDGSFSSQENLLLMGDDGLHPMGEGGIEFYSKGNGMGDFDNDGDFDYIMGDGFFGGDIFLFEKIGPGNQFASPVVVAVWSTGYFPMDMAVADFNEDGNFDFVISYYSSFNCGLYLGDGALGFTGPSTDSAADPLLLKDAAPYLSAGVDAADFNNDGHADFVIAPSTSGQSTDEPFFVNLGDGQGNFTTLTFEGLKDPNANYVPYYGVAAADFNSDGNVDIAAAYYDYLDIYEGNGDGTFKWSASYEVDLNLSPLDNYDFNGDGNQDLVAANFGSAGSGVAVLLGNGDGSFAEPVIYGGGTDGERNAVSAPPPPLELNKEPVAVVEPMYLEVTVGEKIVFDGSASYDDDGQIVSYEWDFGDGNINAGVVTALSLSKTGRDTDEVAPSHIYYDAGKYTVMLKVTDDKGATASVQAEVNALPVGATIQFKPDTLYLKNKGKWIRATIRLPVDYDAREIDDPSVCIVLDDGSRICAYSDYGNGFLAKIKKRFYRTKKLLTVRFNRQDLIQKIEIPSENTLLTVQGDILFNGAWIEFEGSGIIRALEGEKKEGFFRKYWKRNIKRFSKK